MKGNVDIVDMPSGRCVCECESECVTVSVLSSQRKRSWQDITPAVYHPACPQLVERQGAQIEKWRMYNARD